MVIRFGQSDSHSSSDEPLHSNAHHNCHCVIALNTKSGKAHMFHVWDAAHRGLSVEQKENAEAFAGEGGSIVAVRIRGDRSYITEDEETGKGLAQHYLEGLGIRYIRDIEVPSGDDTWGVLFNPRNGKVTVTVDKNGRELYSGKLFEEYLPSLSVPPRKSGQPSIIT